MSANYSVEISVIVLRHIVVNDNIDSFDVDSSSEDVGGNHDSVLEVFEILEMFDSVGLVHSGVNCDRGEILLLEQFVEGDGSGLRFHEDNRLELSICT
jgi:hypothetical protein